MAEEVVVVISVEAEAGEEAAVTKSVKEV